MTTLFLSSFFFLFQNLKWKISGVYFLKYFLLSFMKYKITLIQCIVSFKPLKLPNWITLEMNCFRFWKRQNPSKIQVEPFLESLLRIHVKTYIIFSLMIQPRKHHQKHRQAVLISNQPQAKRCGSMVYYFLLSEPTVIKNSLKKREYTILYTIHTTILRVLV